MSLYNYFQEVNNDIINNTFIRTQQNLDEISRKINALNNSQADLPFLSTKYNEKLRLLDEQLNNLESIIQFNNGQVERSTFLKKYNIDVANMSSSKIDEILQSEQNKELQSSTFLENMEVSVTNKSIIQTVGLLIILLFFYFYV